MFLVSLRLSSINGNAAKLHVSGPGFIIIFQIKSNSSVFFPERESTEFQETFVSEICVNFSIRNNFLRSAILVFQHIVYMSTACSLYRN